MSLWRCPSPTCPGEGKPFEAEAPKDEAPVCPHCQLDGRDPKWGKFFERLCYIHFDPPSGILPGVGKNMALCDGKPIRTLKRGHQATSDRGSVTCAACLAHPDFPKEDDDTAHVPDWRVGRQMKRVN